MSFRTLHLPDLNRHVVALMVAMLCALAPASASAAFFEPGDADGDCYVTPNDVWLIHMIAAGMLPATSAPGDGDCYVDSVVNYRDIDCAISKSRSNVFSQVCVNAWVPDPSDIAPELDTFGTFRDSISFLYSSTPPVQRDADGDALAQGKLAVVRGRVIRRSGAWHPGVKVDVLDHPEYGYTHTRTDGQWDLVVHGGQALTFVFGFEGGPPVQRTITVKANEINVMDDVALIEFDVASVVEINSAQFQTHRATPTLDEAGPRRATVMIRPETTVEMEFDVGEPAALTGSVTLRATEYTVGLNGPEAMPGNLPLTTAYTYAVELSLDEAIAAGATKVNFTTTDAPNDVKNAPLIFYVENFLNFPSGELVPVGWYDLAEATWVPSRNGRIVTITDRVSGSAVLDIDGDAEIQQWLTEEGVSVSDDERLALGAIYPIGTSLWRVPITHLTPWDLNWPYGPPEGASSPGDEGGGGGNGGANSTSEDDNHDPCDKNRTGSIIECTNQVLIEELPLAGLPVSLVYRSDRVPGHRASYIAHITLQDGPLPEPAPKRIDLVVEIAGQRYEDSVVPTAGKQVYEFTWDGLNSYGQPVDAATVADVAVGYVYDAVYYATAGEQNEAFGSYPASAYTTASKHAETTIWSHFPTVLGPAVARDPRQLGLGGWSLDILQELNVLSYGEKFEGEMPSSIGTTIAGVDVQKVFSAYCGTDVPGPDGIAVPGPDGIDYCGRLTSTYNSSTEEFAHVFNLKWTNADDTAAEISHDWSEPFPYSLKKYNQAPGGLVSMKARGTSVYALFRTGLLFRFETKTGEKSDRALIDTAYKYGPQHFRDFEIDDEGNVYLVGDLSWTMDEARILKVRPNGQVDEIRHQALFYNPVSVSIHPDGQKLAVGKGIFDGADQSFRNYVRGYLNQNPQNPQIPPIPAFSDCVANSVSMVDPRVLEVSLGSGSVAVVLGEPVKAGLLCTSTNIHSDSVGCKSIRGNGSYFGSALAFPVNWLVSRTLVDYGPGGDLFVAHAPYLCWENGSTVIFRLQPDGYMAPYIGGQSQPFVQGLYTNPHWYAPPTRRSFMLGKDLFRLSIEGSRFFIFGSETIYAGRVHYSVEDSPIQLPLTDALDGLSYTVAPDDDHITYHVFDDEKKHIMDVDGTTGAVLFEFEYDPAGRLSRVVDSLDNELTVSYDSSGAWIQAFGLTHRLLYPPDGYLQTVIYPNNATYRLSYDPAESARGLLTDFTPPKGAGNKSIIEYDSLGRLVQDTNGAGMLTHLAKQETSGGLSVTATTAEGRQVVYDRFEDEDGTAHRSATWLSGGATALYESASVDPAGAFEIQSTDGTLVSGTFDDHPAFGPDVPTLKSVSVTTPSGLRQDMTAVHDVEPKGAELRWNFTSETLSVSVNGATSPKLLVNVDYDTMTVGVTSREGRPFQSSFDSLGRLQTISVPGVAPVSYAYDVAGRLDQVTQAGYYRQLTYDGVLPFVSYDEAGEALLATDSASYTRDSVGRVQGVSFGGAEIDARYDLHGNPQSVSKWHDPSDPSPLLHGFGWDEADRLTASELAGSAGAAAFSYGYDLDGLVTSETFAGSPVADVTHDDLGRPMLVTHPEGQISLAYDPTSGYLSDVVSGADSLSLTHDGFLLTRVVSQVASTGSDVAYVYDNDWNLVGLDVQDASVDFAHDLDGLMIAAQPVGGSAMQLQYDPNGVKNGLLWKTGLGGLETTRTYDNIARFSAVGTVDAGSSFAYGFALGYSAYYRIGTYTETLSVPGAPPSIEWEYTYDDAARVVGAERREGQQTTIWSYDYDANGNRLVETIDGVTVTAQYDSRDRLVSTSQGATVFTYVLNGNLESRATGALTTTYDYDPFGRLRGVSLPDGDLVSYDLDVAGRRVAKRLNGAVVKQWAYRDFLRPVAELDGATVTALFVYTPEHHAPSSMVKGGVTYRILTNAQGSVRLVVNAATGQVAQELEYDPFGRVIKDTNPGFQPFAFAGGLYDPDTGLVHFGHREYDADTGRWTTIDPIQLAGGDTNYYAYVANDPVNRIDLNGLRAISDWVMPPYDGTDWQDEARSDLADVTFDVLLSFVPMPPVLKAFKWAQEWHKARKAEKIAKATAGAAEQAAKCIGKVIGRTKDLLKPGALRAGEEGLIVRVGKTYKDTWKSNSGALRKAMKSGQPIRDASVGKKGPFLDAERALLKDKGWLFDGTFWRP